MRTSMGRNLLVAIAAAGLMGCAAHRAFTAEPGLELRGCEFAGVKFTSGAANCQAGTQYRCEDGSWKNLGTACTTTASGVPIKVAPVAGGSCTLEGTAVGNSSTICSSGTTLLCKQSEWVDLGTACW
jgi:hypothetical protein